MSADLRARLKWLMLTRATLATTIGAGLVLLQLWVQAPELWGSWLKAIGPILLTSYLLNFISWPLLKYPRLPLAPLAYLHLLIDVVTSGLLIWYTGRLESPLSFFLPICVLFGATLFERTGAWVSAILGVGVIFVICLMEGAEIDFKRLTDTSETLRRLLMSGLTQIGVITLVATLAAHLSERLKTAHLRLQIADRDLRTLRRLNERLLTRSQSGVVHLDQEGRVLFMNPAAARLLRLDALSTLNRALFAVAPWLRPAGDALHPSLSEAHYWEADQEGLTLACALSPAERPAEGEGAEELEESGAALLLQDITKVKQRRREEERRAHLASIGELTAQLAHELRNPLASIRNSLQLLQRAREGDPQEIQRRLLSILDRETARLAELTQSFLDVARPPEPQPYLTPLAPLLSELCTLTSHPPCHTLIAQGERALKGVTAWVDPDHLRQILINLIKNAHEAYDHVEGEPQAEALLDITPHERLVEISVLDRGEGLPQDLEDIFTPFQTTKERGSGLGLALSRALAESNGGSLTAHHRAGGGAQLTLLLKARPDQDEEPKPRSDMLIQVIDHD